MPLQHTRATVDPSPLPFSEHSTNQTSVSSSSQLFWLCFGSHRYGHTSKQSSCVVLFCFHVVLTFFLLFCCCCCCLLLFVSGSSLHISNDNLYQPIDSKHQELYCITRTVSKYSRDHHLKFLVVNVCVCVLVRGFVPHICSWRQKRIPR